MSKLQFDGPRNFRDLGGLRGRDGKITRRRCLFRSDGLSQTSDSDLSRLKQLNLATIIDLRTTDETTRAPSRLPSNQNFSLHHLGFLPNGTLELFDAVNRRGIGSTVAHEMMASNYARMPFDHADSIRAVFQTIGDEQNLPCLFHCTSGKDRTGVVSALLLLALGVSEQDVIADYKLSNIEHQPVDVFGADASAAAVAKIMSADGDFIAAMLAAIMQRFNSYEDYFEEILGFNSVWLAALRERLLVSPRPGT